MLAGEAHGLRTERMRQVRSGIHRKDFFFQVRNDDGLGHFRNLSSRHWTLSFVLVYADPNVDDYGSYFMKAGVVRQYRVSEKLKTTTMRKHRVREDSDDDRRFWEAAGELMNLAEARWTHR